MEEKQEEAQEVKQGNKAPETSSTPTDVSGGGDLSQKHLMIGGVVVVIVIVLALAGVFSGGSKGKVAGAFGEMVEALEEAETMEFEGNVAIEVTTPETPDLTAFGGDPAMPAQDVDITMTFDGALDERDEERPLSSLRMTLVLPENIPGLPTEGGEPIAFEIRSEAEVMYMRLTSFPEIPFFDLSQFLNTWIELDVERLAELQGVDIDMEQLSSEEFEEETLEMLEDFMKDVFRSDALTLSDSLGERQISGVTTTGYTWTADIDAFLEVYAEFAEEVLGSGLYGEEFAVEDFDVSGELDELGSVNEFVAVSGELWIAENNLPYEFSVNIVPMIEEAPEFRGVSATFTATSYDIDVTIDIPTESTSFEELLGDLFGGFNPFMMDAGGGEFDPAAFEADFEAEFGDMSPEELEALFVQ